MPAGFNLRSGKALGAFCIDDFYADALEEVDQFEANLTGVERRLPVRLAPLEVSGV